MKIYELHTKFLIVLVLVFHPSVKQFFCFCDETCLSCSQCSMQRETKGEETGKYTPQAFCCNSFSGGEATHFHFETKREAQTGLDLCFCGNFPRSNVYFLPDSSENSINKIFTSTNQVLFSSSDTETFESNSVNTKKDSSPPNQPPTYLKHCVLLC